MAELSDATKRRLVQVHVRGAGDFHTMDRMTPRSSLAARMLLCLLGWTVAGTGIFAVFLLLGMGA